MGYFEGGSQTLIDRLKNAIEDGGGMTHLNAKVQKISKTNQAFQLFLDSGKRDNYDRVVLAVPLPLTAKMMKNLDEEYAHKLSTIVFFGVICGIFRLREKVNEAFWLNINDPRIAAFVFFLYTNLNPLQEIYPHRIVYLPFYLPPDDRWLSMSEEFLGRKFFDIFKIIKPTLDESTIVDFRVFKSLYAQAICTTGFQDKVPPFQTPIRKLYLLDSTQIYPSDRALSALIGLAEKMVEENF
jgi:protoporphyrinogen oxidase